MDKLKTLIVLFKAHTSIGNNVKLSLKESVLTLNEFSAMEAIYTKGALQTKTLAESILVPNSSLTYVLDTLEKNGYICREKDSKDKRRQLIDLTPLGKEVFEKIYVEHYAHMKTIFDVLTDDEKEQLEQLLKKVGKKAEEVLGDETC